MGAKQLTQLLDQQALFMRQTIEAQSTAQNTARDTMAAMVTTLQNDLKSAIESRSRPRDKEGLTTKKAFSFLPGYAGKPEEYDGWKFQLT